MSLSAMHDRSNFDVRLAQDKADLRAAQALRYDVFVTEMGGDGAMVDHHAGIEQDRFDAVADHLLLIDRGTGAVVGVYRLLRSDLAAQIGDFYSATEYDLAPLLSSGRRLLELGRSCLHPDYRGGMGMFALWSGLARYVAQHGIEILFGVASFRGCDVQEHAQSLSLLHQRHLAPPDIRVRARGQPFQRMDLIEAARVDRKAAMIAMPSLIKSYLRLGGTVGEGAFVDRAFNTVDVCMIMDTKRLNTQQARRFGVEIP